MSTFQCVGFIMCWNIFSSSQLKVMSHYLLAVNLWPHSDYSDHTNRVYHMYCVFSVVHFLEMGADGQRFDISMSKVPIPSWQPACLFVGMIDRSHHLKKATIFSKVLTFQVKSNFIPTDPTMKVLAIAQTFLLLNLASSNVLSETNGHGQVLSKDPKLLKGTKDRLRGPTSNRGLEKTNSKNHNPQPTSPQPTFVSSSTRITH